MREISRLADRGLFSGVVCFLSPLSSGAWSLVLSATSYFTPPVMPDNASLLAGLNYTPGTEQITDQTYKDYVFRLGVVPPSLPQPALCQAIPASVAESYVANTLTTVFPASSSEGTFIQLFPWKAKPFTRPLFRVPSEESQFSLGLLRIATDQTTVNKMLQQHRSLYEQNRSLGGTLYPFSSLYMSREDWRLHYGPSWELLAGAKRRYDPDNVFASGPNIFGGLRQL